MMINYGQRLALHTNAMTIHANDTGYNDREVKIEEYIIKDQV